MSKNLWTSVPNTSSTAVLASVLPSFVLVWPSNWGSGCFMEIIATSPFLISLPSKFSSLSLSTPSSLAYWFITRVSAVLKPVTRVPPSTTFILLQYGLICSEKFVVYWNATSTSISPLVPSIYTGSLWRTWASRLI